MVDDEEQHVVTAGSIITVTVLLERGSLGDFMSDSGENPEDAEDPKQADSAESCGHGAVAMTYKDTQVQVPASHCDDTGQCCCKKNL